MSSPTRDHFPLCFAMIAGGLDFCTGLALVAAPAFTLSVMGVAAPTAEAMIFVRFVGVFVAAVGASYLWASAFGNVAAFRTMLQLTLLFRLGAGVFTGIAVLTSALTTAWLGVTATDLACVVIQAWLLSRTERTHA